MTTKSAEHRRLAEHRERLADWRRWGPYLSERAWGTVREDYSADGDAWRYFPHDHARSRAYRWNEDGLAGISDRDQHLCFALALWNGQDPFLKERLFGLTGPQGNHGEDVKESYFYLDSTPTHSYMRMLYKYPQGRFPYDELVAQNARRGHEDPEFELEDTGAFDGDRYFDVDVQYAKVDQRDILIRIDATNRGEASATLHLLPTLWFRNTWSWGHPDGPMLDAPQRPWAREGRARRGAVAVEASHPSSGHYNLYAAGTPTLLFCDNETNTERLWGRPCASPYPKDAFHRHLVDGEQGAVNPKQRGTKACAHYRVELPPGGTFTARLRLCSGALDDPLALFDALMERRLGEADMFFASVHGKHLSRDEQRVQRQALAGMLWSKQLYYYDVEQWLKGDPGHPPPPEERRAARNSGWTHLINFDVISMPDKWEYPWYATWDLAFHCLPLALVDPDYAKRQLSVTTREWYMHPNGQLPAYEWDFNDANPPVHAWAAWRLYKMDALRTGHRDRPFLEGIFHKLLLNFTWWVNRKDHDENNVFQGGFLGLDNISLFDRSAALPTGGHIDQSDGTAWMGAYCLTMMTIALELAREDPVYQDSASKFFEHFLRIGHAMTTHGDLDVSLWDEQDGFFYDMLHLPDGAVVPLKVRSLVGLLPLFAVETIEPELLRRMPTFSSRMRWFLEHRGHLASNVASVRRPGVGERRLVALVNRERLVRVLSRLLDEQEFLSPYGIRSVSRHHLEHPFRFQLDGQEHVIGYEPAESQSGMFGGNSNWRGPIWFPTNFLLIESLQKFHHYYGDTVRVECPTGSGNLMDLSQVAAELATRLCRLFLRDHEGRRPFRRAGSARQADPHWRDLLRFNEYFNGDSGEGLGAAHQTGWTGLVAKLLHSLAGQRGG